MTCDLGFGILKLDKRKNNANLTPDFVKGTLLPGLLCRDREQLAGGYLWQEDAWSQVVRITDKLLPRAGQPIGAAYAYTDTTIISCAYYRCGLELIDTNNNSSYSEPGSVGNMYTVYLPTVHK